MKYEKYEKLREKFFGRGLVVAIDGPSGTGKSTIARRVAAALDLAYLDTGAMYRAAAWWVDHRGLAASQSEAVVQVVREMNLEVTALPQNSRIFVDGIEVSRVIRSEQVNRMVSDIAAIPQVRQLLISQQRDIIAQACQSTRGIVAEGRDITTVVAPHAPVRILLTADPQVRLSRRARQDAGSTEADVLERERELVLARDAKDSQVNNFFQAAPGVQVVDSTCLSVDQTMDAVMDVIGQTTV